MTTFTVGNLASTGAGSLRDAVDQANANAGADTIVFAAGLSGTIQLTDPGPGGDLRIAEALTITGPGASVLKVVGAPTSTVVSVNQAGAVPDVVISGLTLSGDGSLSPFAGGGIHINEANVHLIDVAITGAVGGLGGGIYFSGAGLLWVEGSTISGNSGDLGGGVYIDPNVTAALFVNSTIANNSATRAAGPSAGGVFAFNGSAIFRNVTIAGNSAVSAGGAGGARVNFGTLTFENSIVSNATSVVGDIAHTGGTVSASYTLIKSNASAVPLGGGPGNIVGSDPLLGPLAQNGGQVLTMAPAYGSPAFNAGNPAFAPPPSLDARGQARISGGRIDLGAVELIVPLSTPEGAAPTPDPPPSKGPLLSAAFANILRYAPVVIPPLPATVITPAGQALPSPFQAQLATLKTLVGAVDAGTLALQAAVDRIVDMADGTTSVGVLSYQFFTGRIPTKDGLDYLVSSPQNGADLNDGYYAGVGMENRYINLAVSLATTGEGRAAFAAGYGPLSLADATAKAYAEIFGKTPEAAKLADLLAPERIAYLNALGGDSLGAKAAMVGWLLAEAAKADIGPYAVMNENFLYDLADGVAGFGADLHIYLTAGPRTVGLVGVVDGA